MKIPIRRISLFDINKNREQVKEINARLKEIARRLKHLTECAVEYLEGILDEIKNFTKLDSKKDPRAIDPKLLVRQTKIMKFGKIDVKDAVSHDLSLRYDDNSGYLGINVSGGREIMKVGPYDRIFALRRTGVYTVFDVPQKVFVDKDLWYCGPAEKEKLSKVLFTIFYRDPETKFVYIKKCRVEQYIINRDYVIIPDGMELLHVDTRAKFSFTLHYEPKPRLKILTESFKSQSFEEKGLKAQGVRLASKETASIEIDTSKSSGFIQGELDLGTEPEAKAEKKTAKAAPKAAKTAPKAAPKAEAKATKPAAKPIAKAAPKAESALATMELKPKAAKPAKQEPAKAAKAEKAPAKQKAADVAKAAPKKTTKSALATMETKASATKKAEQEKTEEQKASKSSLTAKAEALKKATKKK